MIKYGVSQKQVDDLIKLGVCHDEEAARKLVATGEAGLLIKEAKATHNLEKEKEENA